MKKNRVFRVGLLALSSFAACAVFAADNNNALSNKTDRLSYAIGVQTGKSFKSHNVEINSNVYMQGLKDGLNGSPTMLNNDQIQQELRDLQQSTMAKMQTEQKQLAEKNHQLGNAFLAANKDRPGVVTTSSGLQYKILTPGKGPKPTLNDTVTVEYEGRLLNGNIFDSSYERGQPTTFPVNAVIAGWQEALKLMPVGSVWEIYIPSDLAYGEQGAQNVIGPNETLIFKVHLVSIQPSTQNNNTNNNTDNTKGNQQS